MVWQKQTVVAWQAKNGRIRDPAKPRTAATDCTDAQFDRAPRMAMTIKQLLTEA